MGAKKAPAIAPRAPNCTSNEIEQRCGKGGCAAWAAAPINDWERPQSYGQPTSLECSAATEMHRFRALAGQGETGSADRAGHLPMPCRSPDRQPVVVGVDHNIIRAETQSRRDPPLDGPQQQFTTHPSFEFVHQI